MTVKTHGLKTNTSNIIMFFVYEDQNFMFKLSQ